MSKKKRMLSLCKFHERCVCRKIPSNILWISSFPNISFPDANICGPCLEFLLILGIWCVWMFSQQNSKIWKDWSQCSEFHEVSFRSPSAKLFLLRSILSASVPSPWRSRFCIHFLSGTSGGARCPYEAQVDVLSSTTGWSCFAKHGLP